MASPIVVPTLGYAAPLLSVWHLRPGEQAIEGDCIVELLLGAATFDVPAPCTGRLVAWMAVPEEHVMEGQVLGYIEPDPDAGPT